MTTAKTDTQETVMAGQPLKMELPESLRRQLSGYRKSVRITKIAEAALASMMLLFLGFLLVYSVDRLGDTPGPLRGMLFVTCLLGCLFIPLAIYRWFWQSRQWVQVARLIRQRQFNLGDHLLSAIELSENPTEQNRSPQLCAAALRQVAERAAKVDFLDAAPRHFLGWLAITAGGLGAIALSIVILYPEAAGNAWLRFAAPWRSVERYTFTAVVPLPKAIVVPHGEEFPLEIQLRGDSRWLPETASIQMRRRPKIYSNRMDNNFSFDLPPLQAATPMRVRVGDFGQSVQVTPKVRPELVRLTAKVQLPDYLQRPETISLDVRSGMLSAVENCRVILEAEASSDLCEAFIGGRSVSVDGTVFVSDEIEIGDYARYLTFQWRDVDGLSSRQPFTLEIEPFEDEPPEVLALELSVQSVVLDSEQLNFQALAADDFGIRRIGIAWQGVDESLVARPASGHKIIAAGGPDQTNLQVPATFSAAALGIEAQPIELTLWVEDYLPGRPPVYSAPFQLYILTADEHAIWITGQINKWHRSALDVRDTEMQLYQTNAMLRSASTDELQSGRMQDALVRQAALEEANSRQLRALTNSGVDLLRQAIKNPDIAPESVENLAGMIDVLSDIAQNKMPRVSDLLKSASREIPTTVSNEQSSSSDSTKRDSHQAGQVRAKSSSDGNSEQPRSQDSQQVSSSLPSLVDIESSMQPLDSPSMQSARQEDQQEDQQEEQQSQSSGRLSLPATALMGQGQSVGEQGSQDDKRSADRASKPSSLDNALVEQKELLAQFEKIADDLNAVMANLEGSTLVKRLKAASREQSMVADKIASRIDLLFGRGKQVEEQERQKLESLAATEHQSSQTLSFIMDDMQAYFDRRRIPEIAMVLDEMKESDVLVALKKLGDQLVAEQGLSIAQAEYWADTLDRWAEDLIDSSESSGENSDAPRDSLPPAAILEMLTILESQVNLREETRVAQQARPALDESEIDGEIGRLAELQSQLKRRVENLAVGILELPDGSKNFEQELSLFSAVDQAMGDARYLLGLGNTGAETIAAQTEAIELLLQSQRINPQGGGGGGANPGTGATGDAQDSALALLGAGLNQNAGAQSRQVEQAVGSSGERLLPEEYRAGLDAYFQRLESRQ